MLCVTNGVAVKSVIFMFFLLIAIKCTLQANRPFSGSSFSGNHELIDRRTASGAARGMREPFRPVRQDRRSERITPVLSEGVHCHET